MTVHSLHVDLRAVAPDYDSVLVEITDRYGVTTRQMVPVHDRCALEQAIEEHVRLSQQTTRRN